MTNLKDSGKREQFGKDGAVRDGEVGKGRYDLLSPLSHHRLALWFEAGGLKYKDRNWENGMPLSQYVDSAKRHLEKAICGLDDEDHWAAFLWNAHCLIHTKEAIDRGLLSKELDDLPYYFKDDQKEGQDFFEPAEWIQELAVKHKDEAKEDESVWKFNCGLVTFCSDGGAIVPYECVHCREKIIHYIPEKGNLHVDAFPKYVNCPICDTLYKLPITLEKDGECVYSVVLGEMI